MLTTAFELQTPSNSITDTTPILLPILVQKEAENPSAQTGLLQNNRERPFDATIRNEIHAPTSQLSASDLSTVLCLVSVVHQKSTNANLLLKKGNNHSNILVQPNSMRDN